MICAVVRHHQAVAYLICICWAASISAALSGTLTAGMCCLSKCKDKVQHATHNRTVHCSLVCDCTPHSVQALRNEST